MRLLQICCLFAQMSCLAWQVCTTRDMYSRAKEHLDRAAKIYEDALEGRREFDRMKTFSDTTFCTCESCTNRECPRKLTRLVIADAVMMEIPVRVGNFYGSCSAYTEVEEC